MPSFHMDNFVPEVKQTGKSNNVILFKNRVYLWQILIHNLQLLLTLVK